MLLGVEFARRRRFYHSRGQPNSPVVTTTAATTTTRRFSFCLYTTYDAATSSSLQSRSIINQAYEDDEELGGVAREAKHRLDERLRIQRKPEIMRRHDDGESSRARELQLQTMVHGVQSVGRGSGSTISKRFGWGKMMRWRATDQDECAICLERFEVGETLIFKKLFKAIEHNSLAISAKLGLSDGSDDQHLSISDFHSGLQDAGTCGRSVLFKMPPDLIAISLVSSQYSLS
ncbi:hypothetical protein NL676_036246 [Syzygium grande]|nr:hypothetical protein NL676_036246 [Syzygium grande]